MKKLFVAGHRGMVGSAVCRLNREYELITADRSIDLQNQTQVNNFIKQNKPDCVIICAAKVGGIKANSTYPAEFIYNNLTISTNIIHSSYINGIKDLIFLGSSCIYPKYASQPIKETELLTSPLESSNEAYAIAKIAGLKMCQYYRKQYNVNYISLMPTNLYGVGDNYHPENSHVIPGLIGKLHKAKTDNNKVYKIWGSGTPKREFLYVDDLANVCIKLLANKNLPDWINVGSDQELSIIDLAHTIADIVGFTGEIIAGDSNLDGTPRKKLDCTLLKNIVSYKETPLEEGIKKAYEDFLSRKCYENI